MIGLVCQRVLAGVRHPAVALAWRDMGGTTPGLAAWALVTGVAMVKAGLSVPLAVFMTLAVYAGSAQLAVLPLMVAGAPLWVVWFTALCVNLRFVILSSLWRCYFDHLPLRQRLALGYFSGDVIFVAFTQRYTTLDKTPEQLPYFWGCAAINWLSWQLGALAGIFLAHLIPLEWGLGFAGVLAATLGNTGGGSAAGIAAMLGATLLFTLAGPWNKRLNARADSFAVCAVNLTVGGAVLLALGLLGGGRLRLAAQNRAAGAVVLLFLAFISAAGYLLWALLMKNNPVSRISVFGLLIPVVTTLLSALLNGEPLWQWQYLAALALVCTGILLVNRPARVHREEDPA